MLQVCSCVLYVPFWPVFNEIPNKDEVFNGQTDKLCCFWQQYTCQVMTGDRIWMIMTCKIWQQTPQTFEQPNSYIKAEWLGISLSKLQQFVLCCSHKDIWHKTTKQKKQLSCLLLWINIVQLFFRYSNLTTAHMLANYSWPSHQHPRNTSHHLSPIQAWCLS